MMTAQALTVLAMMLSLQQPGRSYYSVTVVPKDAKPHCNVPGVPMCRKPKYSKAYKAYVRPESWEEGVKRYATMARAIVDVANDMTRRTKDACDDEKSCEALERKRPWKGTSKELQRVLASIGFHESVYRADVERGIGKLSRGDCDRNGRNCESVSIFQLKIGKNLTRIDDWNSEQLVGDDYASVRRAAITAVRHLSNVYRPGNGRKRLGPIHPYSIFAAYGGVATRGKDPRILARAKTYRRTLFARPLKDKVKRVLGIPIEEKKAKSPRPKPQPPRHAPKRRPKGKGKGDAKAKR